MSPVRPRSARLARRFRRCPRPPARRGGSAASPSGRRNWPSWLRNQRAVRAAPRPVRAGRRPVRAGGRLGRAGGRLGRAGPARPGALRGRPPEITARRAGLPVPCHSADARRQQRSSPAPGRSVRSLARSEKYSWSPGRQASCAVPAARPAGRPAAGAAAPPAGECGNRLAARVGKAVVGVGPGGCLRRIRTSGADQRGETGQPGAAALADGGERNLVPGQRQGDLVRIAQPVPACHGSHGENRTIDAE